MTSSVSLFLVDDEPDVTRSLSWLLETVGQQATSYHDPEIFLKSYTAHYGPCCIILDLRMPGVSGLEVLEKQQELGRVDPVIFLTGHGDVPSAVRAMKLGAFDFLTKPFNPQEFLDCVNRAITYASKAHQKNIRKLEERAVIGKLSSRETDVFDQLIKGFSSKEIARDLNISPKTVDVHRANILKKIGISTVRELIQRYYPEA